MVNAKGLKSKKINYDFLKIIIYHIYYFLKWFILFFEVKIIVFIYFFKGSNLALDKRSNT